MLRGIEKPDMPYRDPHTAAPALWALMRSTRCEFEVAALPVAGNASRRKGLEAVAIALYRQEAGCSPSVNFGRMPSGFQMSSGNTQKLEQAGSRFRGGPVTTLDPSHLPGTPPVGGLGAQTAEGPARAAAAPKSAGTFASLVRVAYARACAREA